ncbi:hypothetical protein Aperf_G00000099895 [Anoplocephala perfoliata]
MEGKCLFCNLVVPENVYHEHVQKCMRLMEQSEENRNTFDGHTSAYPAPSFNEPEYSKYAFNPSQHFDQYEKDFLLKTQLTNHLRSKEPNNPIRPKSYSEIDSSRPKSTDLLRRRPQTGLNIASPIPLEENNVNNKTNQPMDQNEIRLIVREEIAKYLRQLLQIVESDICTNGSIP